MNYKEQCREQALTAVSDNKLPIWAKNIIFNIVWILVPITSTAIWKIRLEIWTLRTCKLRNHILIAYLTVKKQILIETFYMEAFIRQLLGR